MKEEDLFFIKRYLGLMTLSFSGSMWYVDGYDNIYNFKLGIFLFLIIMFFITTMMIINYRIKIKKMRKEELREKNRKKMRKKLKK